MSRWRTDPEFDDDAAPFAPSPFDVPDPADEMLEDFPYLPGSAPTAPRGGVDWSQIESGLARPLADASAAVARLDERLLGLSASVRDGLRLRLALEAVTEILWQEGIRLRREEVLLADLGAARRDADHAPALGRAAWGIRRMTASGLPPETAVELYRFLGRLSGSSGVGPSDPGGEGLDPAAVEAVCATLSTLDAVHLLTRAGACLWVWRAHGVGPRGNLLEPLLLAGRVGAVFGRSGICSLPVDATLAPFGRAGTADPVGFLGGWLEALAGAAEGAAATVSQVIGWRDHCAKSTDDLNGKGAPALGDLLMARPAVSARTVAEALSLSRGQARTLLGRFEDRGLISELTGQGRFRFWSARLSGGAGRRTTAPPSVT